MSLFDSASLVVTPNGYKASKVYSVIPSDGTGDFAWGRAGNTATRVNASGLIEAVNADIPRLDYFGGGCPKLLLEPQRTNLFLQSNDISNAAWDKVGLSITSNNAISPQGTQNAGLLTATGGQTFHDFYQAFTGSSTGNCTISAFFKKNTQRYFYISINRIAEAFEFVVGVFDVDNKTFTTYNNGGFTNLNCKVEDYGNGWIRCIVSATCTTVSTSMYTFIGFNNSANFQETGTSRGRSIYNNSNSAWVYGVQCETASYATSYIPTTTAAVTRGADDNFVKTSAGSFMNSEMTLYYHGISPKSVNTNRELWIKGGGGFYDNLFGLEYLFSTTATFKVFLNTTSSQFEFFRNTPVNTEFKMAIRMKQNDIALYFNGALVGTDTSATIPSFTTIYIGKYLDIPVEDNQVKGVAIWKTGLSNADLAALTSL